MLAAWYEQPGPAAEALQVGDMADPMRDQARSASV